MKKLSVCGEGTLIHPVTRNTVTTIVFEREGWGKVFEVFDYSGDPDGNARLIAAAPDLLAALEILVDHAQETYPHFESERGQRDIQAALDAIKRAKG